MPVTLPTDLHHSPAQHQTVATTVATGAKAKNAAKQPARTVRDITVRAGESVYSIARREHSSVAAILKANPKLDVRHIVPGTKIRVPGPVATPAHTAAKPTSSAAAAPTSAPQFAPKPTHVITYTGTKAARGYSKEQVAAGDAHRKQLAQADLPTSEQLKSMIVATAKQHGVSPTLALGIGMQESGFQQSAVSVCDAIGTMQVMPETGRWAGQIVGAPLDLLQAQDNITAGVTTLRYLTTHARDQDEVIGSYYQGLGAMQKHGPFEDTKRYIAGVKTFMKQFGDH